MMVQYRTQTSTIDPLHVGLHVTFAPRSAASDCDGRHFSGLQPIDSQPLIASPTTLCGHPMLSTHFTYEPLWTQAITTTVTHRYRTITSHQTRTCSRSCPSCCSSTYEAYCHSP